jgi:hypothetical protein
VLVAGLIIILLIVIVQQGTGSATDTLAQIQVMKDMWMDTYSKVSMGVSYFQIVAIYSRFNFAWCVWGGELVEGIVCVCV